MTLVVNLFAGPGTGKSTTAAAVFANLKKRGINAEIVHEYAKDLTWEQRLRTLNYQPYVLAKQAYHVHRLIGEVDVIVTDSPILMCGFIYGHDSTVAHQIRELALAQFNQWDTFNALLHRDEAVHAWNPKGRNQTQDQAKDIDRKICKLLADQGITYRPYQMTTDIDEIISDDVIHTLFPGWEVVGG